MIVGVAFDERQIESGEEGLVAARKSGAGVARAYDSAAREERR